MKLIVEYQEQQSRITGDANDWFHNSLNHRLDAGKNFLCPIVGDPRSGKSWGALGLGDEIDPSFTPQTLPDRVLGLDVQRFVRNLLNNKYPKRSVVIFDEGAETASAKDHSTRKNKLIRAVGIVYAKWQIVSFWLTPHLAELDRSQRRLIPAYMRVLGRGYFDVQKVESNNVDKDWHYSVGTLNLPPPSNEILEAYYPIEDTIKREIMMEELNRYELAELKRQNQLKRAGYVT